MEAMHLYATYLRRAARARDDKRIEAHERMGLNDDGDIRRVERLPHMPLQPVVVEVGVTCKRTGMMADTVMICE